MAIETCSDDLRRRFVIQFADGRYLLRADYSSREPVYVSTPDIYDAELFTQQSAARYLIRASDPKMNYWYGAIAIAKTKG